MERGEYLDRVAAELKRLTSREREAVRRELDGHIEDHIEALRALGYEDAVGRAVDAMGDPTEVGRAIAKQYPAFWLWLRRAATVLLAYLCMWSMLFVPAWVSGVRNNIMARTNPYRHESSETELTKLDVRMPVGDDVVYLYGVEGYEPGRGGEVRLHLCCYDRSPFGVDGSALGFLSFRAGGGLRPTVAWGSFSSDGATYMTYTVELSPDDSVLTMRYERFGEVVEREIALPEVTE